MVWGDDEHKRAVARRLIWLRAAKGFLEKPWSEWQKHNGDIGETTWMNWEAARSLPSIEQAARICGATGVSLDWIYSEKWGDVAARTLEELRSTTVPERQERKGPGRPRKVQQSQAKPLQ